MNQIHAVSPMATHIPMISAAPLMLRGFEAAELIQALCLAPAFDKYVRGQEPDSQVDHAWQQHVIDVAQYRYEVRNQIDRAKCIGHHEHAYRPWRSKVFEGCLQTGELSRLA